MFSHNGKVSEKQMHRMLVLSTFAGSIFVLPYLSARLFGKSVCAGLLVFLAFAWIYVVCIAGITMRYHKKVGGGQESWRVEDFAEKMGMDGIAGKLLLFIQFVRQLIRLVFYIVLTMEILGEAQVPFMQGKGMDSVTNLLVLLPLLLVVLYGANKEIEQNARLHEMIFWVLFIPFVIMLLFGLKEVDYSIFVPKCSLSLGRMLLYGYALLTFVQPVENYLYLYPVTQQRLERKKKDKNLQVRGWKLWGWFCELVREWLVVVLAAVLSLFILGIYGVNGAGSEDMVTIAIMRYIRLPFGVLERFDVLMVWFFVTGCFVLICNSLYYAGYLLRELCHRKKIYLLIGILILAVGIVVLLPEYSHILILFLCYGALLDIPLSLLVPLLGSGIVEADGNEQEDGMV